LRDKPARRANSGTALRRGKQGYGYRNRAKSKKSTRIQIPLLAEGNEHPVNPVNPVLQKG
jgi:hypothetical protein